MNENQEMNKKDAFYYTIVIGMVFFWIIVVLFVGMGIHGLLNR